jgi:uncharacterized protein YheU (UPF0270 family)
MKLTADTLNNQAGSAVINVGANNGYVEVFVSKNIVHLSVFNKQGDVVHEWVETTKNLRTPYDPDVDVHGGYTTPTFQPAGD